MALPPSPAEVARVEIGSTRELFDPKGITDERKRTIAEVVNRRGQAAFRRRLLDLFGGRCAATGCDAADALEAAHIAPYLGAASNDPSNGLLLRSDIHTLFDLGILCIDANNMQVGLAPRLQSSTYGELHGKTLRLKRAEPSKQALMDHRRWAGL